MLAALTLGLSSSSPSGVSARQVIISLALILWAFRLAVFLAYRVHKTGKDDRFDDKRDNFFAFLGFWVFQMVWVFTVSLPVTLLNAPRVRNELNALPDSSRPPSFGTVRDIVGLIMWAIGWLTEAMADWQRFRFRESHKVDGKRVWCNIGLWRWSRHPNYFGEILLQFGIYTMAVTPAFHGLRGGTAAALHASVIGPVLLTVLLLFVSGLPLSERPGAKKRWEIGAETWEEYQKYLERTSILIPLPPALYRRLPIFTKRTALMEWSLYRFDPAKHADGVGDEETARDSERNQPRNSAEDGLVER